MIYKKYNRFFEKSFSSLIVVDVQPHDVGRYIHFNMQEFSKHVNTFDKILVLFNGDDFGWESLSEMEKYYQELDIDLDKCDFFNKGYGFFRDWMSVPVSDNIIIKTGKYMIDNNMIDSREIYNDELESLTGRDDLIEVPMYFNEELNIKLKEYNNSSLVGGAKNECLYEIMLLSQILNLNLKPVKKFIY